MKNIFFALLLLLLTGSKLRAQDILTLQNLENDTVYLCKNSEVLARIEPQIWAEGVNNYTPFVSWGKDSRFNAMFSSPQGGQVGLVSSVTVTGSVIHFHYQFIPLNNLRVTRVLIKVYWPYSDWAGAPFLLGSKVGKLPLESEKFVNVQSDSGPLSIGPVQPQGLTAQLNGGELGIALEDFHNPVYYLVLNLVRNEDSEKTWDWKTGEERVFDFTLALNQDIASLPVQGRPFSKDLAGYWYGTININGIQYRRAYFFEQEPHELTQAYLDDIEIGKFHLPAENVTLKGSYLSMGINGESDDLTLDLKSHSITGIVKKHGKTASLKLKKGLNFTLPRIDADGDAVTDYSYRVPQTLSDGWPVGDLRKSPLDPQIVERGVREILNQRVPNLQSLIVVQHGHLLLDEYFQGYGPEDLHQLMSVAKSVLSILFGIAQDQGLLNKDQKLFDFYPQYRKKAVWDPRKDGITLGMLLSMTSGFDPSSENETYTAKDAVDFSLNRALVSEPGKTFHYDSEILVLLGDLIFRKSGIDVPVFAQKYLYGPLGIQPGNWDSKPQDGTNLVGYGHWLRPRDMAKVGQLFLDKGKWNGNQVVSEKWVEESTQTQVPQTETLTTDYGYLWWSQQMSFKNRKIQIFNASGLGGQNIFVVPELDLVCVMTGGNYDPTNQDQQEVSGKFGDFFKTYILGAFN